VVTPHSHPPTERFRPLRGTLQSDHSATPLAAEVCAPLGTRTPAYYFYGLTRMVHCVPSAAAFIITLGASQQTTCIYAYLNSCLPINFIQSTSTSSGRVVYFQETRSISSRPLPRPRRYNSNKLLYYLCGYY